MTRNPVDRNIRAEVTRELIADLEAETPRTLEDMAKQQAAIEYLRRKLSSAESQVVTGD